MIDLEIADGVAVITLNAPATRNALNEEMAGQLVAACDEAGRDPSVGTAVIRGAGGTFCSGAERGHLDETGRDPAEERRYAALGGIYRALPSEQVEERAAELARRAARDPQLARKATASLRTELGPPRLPWAAALEVERGPQLRSLRRRVPQ